MPDGAFQYLGYPHWVPYNKGYSILGSIWGVPLIKETTTCDQTQMDLKALTLAVCQGLRSVLPERYQSELYIFLIVGNPIP